MTLSLVRLIFFCFHPDDERAGAKSTRRRTFFAGFVAERHALVVDSESTPAILIIADFFKNPAR